MAEKGVIRAVGLTAASLGAAEDFGANNPAQELTGAGLTGSGTADTSAATSAASFSSSTLGN